MSEQHTVRVGRLSSGGVNVTYRCTAACAHCLPASSPRRDAAYITRQAAREILPLLRARGATSLHIGGGEPFLNFDGLCALLQEMRAANIAAEYVETNAYWASGKPSDAERLSRIARLGAGAVMFSLCPFHTEFVPLARVKNAVRAARAAGIDYFVYQAQFAREVEALGDEGKVHPLAEYEAAFPGGVDALPSRFGVRMCGRAALSYSHLASRSAEEFLSSASPCSVLSRTGHFHADLHGCFIPSGCNGIAIPLGDLDSVGGDRHPAVRLLIEGGIRALVHAAAALGFLPHAVYTNACALCQHARAFLALNHPDGWPDLRPLDFYRELYPEIVRGAGDAGGSAPVG